MVGFTISPYALYGRSPVYANLDSLFRHNCVAITTDASEEVKETRGDYGKYLR
jgi:hypothetical protein